jgi:triosephosphate isomerase
MRKKLLLGNWKMNLLRAEALAFANASVPLTTLAKHHDVLLGVAPTYVCLDVVQRANPALIVSAQDMHYESKGAFTGEISGEMIRDLGITWTLIGHSERRTYFGETNLSCHKKNLKALSLNLTIVYCVGETAKEYEEGETKRIIQDQLRVGLNGVSASDLGRVIIAYEPVWSIGTGLNASKEHAQDIAAYIRSILASMFGHDQASTILILYGGSVKPNNIKEYIAQPDVDGALVGGASLTIESFEALLTQMVAKQL